MTVKLSTKMRQRRHRSTLNRIILAILILAPFALFALATFSSEHSLSTRYIVPLEGGWVIEAIPTNDPQFEGLGPYALVKFRAVSDYGSRQTVFTSGKPDDPNSDALPTVIKVAVSGKYILGQTQTTYFIRDVSASTFRIFQKLDEFHEAVTNEGIDKIELADPIRLTASLSNQVLRPWDYSAMRNRLGHSDIWWLSAFLSIAWGLVFYLGLCLAGRPSGIKKPLLVYAGIAALAIGCDVVVYGIWLPNGMAEFANFIAWPIEFAIVYRIGTFGASLLGVT